MGKGNMLLGQLRGSVGDVTFSVRDGSQISRVRVRVVKNPRTEAQQIQRMILATVSRAYSRLKSIADHAFEGVAYGAKSQQYFLKRNMDKLRAYYNVDSSAADFPLANAMAYALPDDVADAGVGFILSNGSLSALNPQTGENGFVDGLAVTLDAPSGPADAEGSPSYSLANIMTICGAQAGDQITVCGFCVGWSGDVVFKKSRYVLNSELTSEQMAMAWDFLGKASYFDSVKTLVDTQMILEGVKGGNCVRPSSDYGQGASAGAVIVSRKSPSGSWLRSPSILYNLSDELPGYQKDFALPLWMASGTDIETTDARYLNNADI